MVGAHDLAPFFKMISFYLFMFNEMEKALNDRKE